MLAFGAEQEKDFGKRILGATTEKLFEDDLSEKTRCTGQKDFM